ncbi:TPA: MFS transporter [Streptococcus suis]
MKWDNVLLVNRCFFDEVFQSTVEVLFFSVYLGLDFSEFSIIVSICLLVSLIFQIPTGFIADKVGRKKVLLWAKLLDLVLTLVILIIPLFINRNRFIFVLLIESIGAAISALASGNFEVLIFDTFKKFETNEEIFVEKSTRYFSIGAILSALSGLVSTILFGYWAALPLLADFSIKIVKFISFLSLIDDSSNLARDKFELSIFNIQSLLKYKTAFLTIFLFAILFSISRSTFSLYQPILTSRNIPLIYYGILITVINLAVFILSRFIKKYLIRLSLNIISVVSMVILVSQFLLLFTNFFSNTVITFIYISSLLSCMQIIRLFSESMSSYFINIAVRKSKYKTLFFSVYSTIFQILLSLFFFMMGFLENYNLSFISIYLSIVLFGFLLILVTYFTRSKIGGRND